MKEGQTILSFSSCINFLPVQNGGRKRVPYVYTEFGEGVTTVKQNFISINLIPLGVLLR